MFSPVTGEPYIKLIITVHVTSLTAETFSYLESTLTSNGTLDAEIQLRVQKASVANRMLENGNITYMIRMNVYRF